MKAEEINYFEIPIEIRKFYRDVFEVYEIRERLGEEKGIKFYVYTNDHNPPHVHAIYGKYEISISLIDFKVLVGNIPNKNKNIAVQWVKNNKDKLLNYWNDKTIVSSARLTKSMLDFKDSVKM